MVAIAVVMMGTAVKPMISMFGELLKSLMQAAVAVLVAGAALALVFLSLLR
ncbi:hypothetical protein [Asanoa siamensis]|nr:hypothetical protein [Asanoa siamensis]